MAVINDRKQKISLLGVEYFEPVVISAQDYFPFGQEMGSERSFNAENTYRYGFNGKEKDSDGEWGDNTHYDYGFRIYNPAIAKFLSVDPATGELPYLSPYSFAANNPINLIDYNGLWPRKKYIEFLNTILRVAPSREAKKRFDELKDQLHGNDFDSEKYFEAIPGIAYDINDYKIPWWAGGGYDNPGGSVTFDAYGVTLNAVFGGFLKKNSQKLTSVVAVEFDRGKYGKGVAGTTSGESGYLIRFVNSSENTSFHILLNEEDFNTLESLYEEAINTEFDKLLEANPMLKEFAAIQSEKNALNSLRNEILTLHNKKFDQNRKGERSCCLSEEEEGEYKRLQRDFDKAQSKLLKRGKKFNAQYRN